MEVNNIGNNDLVNKNIRSNKAGKSEGASKTSGKKSVQENNDQTISDHITIDKSRYGDEIEFAHQVFNKLQQTSIRKLTDIKENIEKGVYQNKNVDQSVSSQVKNSLLSLESYTIQQANPGTSEKAQTQLAQEDKEKMLNDPDIQKEVSGNIIKDLNVFKKQ